MPASMANPTVVGTKNPVPSVSAGPHDPTTSQRTSCAICSASSPATTTEQRQRRKTRHDMLKFPLLAAVFAGTSLFAATAASAQSMSPQLKEPAAVPLDFLTWIDRDAGWLQEQIAALGGMG